jgi:hypothetical protein
MMSYHHEMYKKAQADLKIARDKMAESNRKHMEELAKIRPSPTIKEVQRAMGLKHDEPEVEERSDDGEDVLGLPVDRAINSEPASGGYKTRELRVKKPGA